MPVLINQGMSRRPRRQPDTIDLDNLLTYLREEHWDTYASSSVEPKRLEIMLNGMGFRVTVRDVEVYRGQDASDAVRAYNEAQ